MAETKTAVTNVASTDTTSGISTSLSGNGGKPAKKTTSTKKVGLIGLVAVVISAMVGGGIYDLPQNMAASASAGSQIIAWVITGIGMWFIATRFAFLLR